MTAATGKYYKDNNGTTTAVTTANDTPFLTTYMSFSHNASSGALWEVKKVVSDNNTYYMWFENEITQDALIPVDGSTRLDDSIMSSLEPYNNNEIKDFNPAYITGFQAECTDETEESLNAKAENRAVMHSKRQVKKITGRYTQQGGLVVSDLKKLNEQEYVLFHVWFVNTNFDNKKYNSMYIYGRYGGVMTLNNAKDIKKRMRYIESPDFMIRDLLVINDNKMKQIYMYNGDSLFSYVEGHAVVTTTEEETNTLLGSLIGRDNFIILRPSLYEEEIIDEPIEKEIAEEPTNKEKYDTTENPKTGIVLGIYVILFLSLALTGLILYSRKNIINKI